MKLFNRTTIKAMTMTLIFFLCATAGCEPLRKKFTRKKKKSAQKKEFVPVLDPLDYPERQDDPARQYRYHFSMWQIWQRDLLMAMDEGGSDKRINYLMNQIIVQMQEMQKFLTGEKHKQLIQLTQKQQQAMEEMSKPSAIRNHYSLAKKVQLIGKQMRQGFRFEQVEQNLKN